MSAKVIVGQEFTESIGVCDGLHDLHNGPCAIQFIFWSSGR